MSSDFPGWLTAAEATEKFGICYARLRRLVKDGILTRGVFSDAKSRPPIYVRAVELAAWKRGGVDAVRRVRGAKKVGA